MDLQKGFKNITEPTLFNLLIIVTLGLIVYMVYLDTRKISLFEDVILPDPPQINVIDKLSQRLAMKQLTDSVIDNQEQKLKQLQMKINNTLKKL